MLIPVVLILNAIYLGSEARVLLPRSLNHTRIVGGEDIEITEAPYQVSIQINGRHYCGGVLVAKDTVLTAAHCTSYASALQVRVGTVFAEEGGQIYAVEKVVRHPNFSMAHLDSDLAVIRLSKPVELSDTVATINMKESDEEVNEGDALLVSGWGSDMPQAPPKLQRVELKKVDRETCLRIYAPAGITAITKTMLCAIAPGGGKGPCFGDSGGPLVHDGKLAGLVSFGIGCARERYPEVFAKVSALRSWIDETMKNM